MFFFFFFQPILMTDNYLLLIGDINKILSFKKKFRPCCLCIPKSKKGSAEVSKDGCLQI